MDYKKFTGYLTNTLDKIYSIIDNYMNNSGNNQLTLDYAGFENSSIQESNLETKTYYNEMGHGSRGERIHKAKQKAGKIWKDNSGKRRNDNNKSNKKGKKNGKH